MEEKERYDRHSYYPQRYIDNETNKIINIKDTLNRQNKRIKELELLLNADKKIKTNSIKGFEKLKEENQQLKERISIKMEELHIAYCGIEDVKTKNGNLKAEIKQLKQSQKQLAIEELENLKKEFYSRKLEYKTMENSFHIYGLRIDRIFEIIDDQIKSLKGEEK